MSITVDEHCWELEVVGAVAGTRRPPHADDWAVTAPDERSGRGLGIVRDLMDVTSVVEVAGRVAVRCGRHR